MVSAILTYRPSMPVNCWATKKGCDRKRWTLRARATDELVLFRELVDAENRDDVLEVLVLLQHDLHVAGALVVLLADDAGREDRRGRGQRIDRRVDAHLGDRAGQNGRRVEVRERGRRRGVRQVVGRHVDRLDRRDRALLGRGDALLQLAHLGREVGLVSDGRRHAAEQRRDFRARLREAEDVVDEEQHVLALGVAEVLGHGQARQAHAQARAGRLGHLAVDQRALRLLGVARRDDARLRHLVVQVVALARALADAREHREAAVVHGDVVDELLDHDGLADAGAAEEAGLAALGVGLEQVDDLDAGLEHLDRGRLLVVLGGLAVDRPALLGLDRAEAVDGLAEDVQDPTRASRGPRAPRSARRGPRPSCRAPCRRSPSSRRSGRRSRRAAARLPR